MGTEGFKDALLSALVIASFMAPAISLLSVSPSSAAPEGLTPRAPIYIDGNAGFTPENGVNGGGTGIEDDPYIIENWDISAGSANGIEIRNTTAYFIIRNCYVHDSGEYYNGISFYNVTNGVVDNNLVENNSSDGIYLGDSNNNLISNNNIVGNNSAGIALGGSDNNALDNNTCSNNYFCGIFLNNSSNNTICNNIAENSQNNHGIELYEYSDNNAVSSNTCSNNYQSGIFLNIYSSNNTICNNIMENNSHGIFLGWCSDNNTVSSNTCSNNYQSGILLNNSSNNNTISNNIAENNTIFLYNSSNNLIENNTCKNSFVGIYLRTYSNNNTLTNNTCENNDFGIQLHENSNNNLIENNTCSNNYYHGISLYDNSDNNLISNNLVENGGNGIKLYDDADNNTISGNICSNNLYDGIALYQSSNNLIDNNLVENNYYQGIRIERSPNNRISNNIVENTRSECGIFIWDSDNNLIENNTTKNNNISGIYLNYSNNNLIKNNIAENNRLGIELYNYSDNNTISGNICSNNLYDGIALYQSSNNLIDNNLVENSYYQGIRLTYSSNNTISNSTVENTREECGIFLWDSDNNLIENCTLKNNNISGIYTREYSNNNRISNNIAENNRHGIELLDSDNNTISGNICSNNLHDGIVLYSSDRNLISNNTCKNNGRDGIDLYYIYSGGYIGSDNNTLDNNTCSNNSYGIYLRYSLNNRIFHNNFVNNAQQARDGDTNYWDDGYPSGGNYWSDYTGADSYSGENQDMPGSDGIGDTPYYIPGDSNRDRYPLMKLRMTPDYIYLTWATPDTAHTINVSWRTGGNYVGEVRYDNEPRGGESGAYSYSAEGTGGLTTPELAGYIHHVELTGLEPDTIYYFICGNSSYGWSDEQSFRTAPDQRTSFRFATGGDSRDDNRWDYHDYWPSARDDVSREMAERNPSFVLFIGDYLWSSEDPGPGYAENDTWDNWLGAAFKYWRTDDDRLIPQIPVIGNHEIVYPEPSNYDPETQATNYYTVFNLPGNERWYALSWGPDLRIIVLDSEVLWESTDAWQEQLEWLESELENSENYLWKVAAFHRPIVSSGGWNWRGRLEDWGYLFTKYGVDVVFQAHIHWYDRTYPIDSDPPPGEVAPLGEGVVYLVSGGWGGPLSSGSPREYTAYGPESIYHFTLVDLFENGTFHSQAIDRYGTVFDEFFIYRDVDVSILPVEKSGPTGATLNYEVTVKNSGNVTDNYELKVGDNSGWSPVLDDNVLEVPAGENMQTTLSVIIPENAMPCTEDNITVIATSQADNTISDSASCIAHVIGLASHDPILIKGNDNFIPANGVVGGSGMENDPYIIENWDISAENAHGIEIRNTSAHFVIRNCYVYDGGENYNGIYLYLVENGEIENNTCSNNKHGIHLESSPNNTVRNNTCSNNREYGIRLSLSSNSNTVRNNTCSNNRECGIYLGCSSNNTLENNTCENNWIGIYLSFSSNNTLEKNTCENNTTHGIYIESSSFDNLINNACLNNHHGIYLSYSSNNNTLDNNICENNTTYGICVASSSYNNLINNACLNNQTLIYSGYLDNNPLVKGSALDIDKIPNGWPTDAQNTTGPQPPAGYEKGALSQTLDYQVVISGVPAYLWYNGCGPTAAGMIIGYWNEHGFDDLVSGSTQEQTNAVNDMISSSGNYDDYCVPIDHYPYLLPDKSEPPVGDEHANNCVADFMKTSQSYYSNYYGWGWFSDVDDALRKYVQMVAPHYKVTVFNAYWGTFTWDSFCDEIDENHPVELLVDTNGDGSTDHFVTAIGYGEQDSTPMYACLNTWDNLIHWYEFAQMSRGQPWGIYGATLFSLEKNSISNGCGTYLFSSNNSIISNNTTSNNFFGIYLDNSFNNTIYHNYLLNNTDNNAYDSCSNYWDNGSEGNYWSDWQPPEHPDADNDGVVDEPRPILGGSNRDNFPLVIEWVLPPRAVEASISPSYQSGPPGTTLVYTVTVKNTGSIADNYTLAVADTENWGPALSENRFENIPAGENRRATLDVIIPEEAVPCTEDNITVTATSQGNAQISDDGSCIAHAVLIYPSEVIVRGKDTAYNINQEGAPPWFEYKVGDLPVNMVAKRVGAGGVFAAGASSTCRNARWNDTDNPGGFDDLLDVAFQWMVPGATNVLWYEGHSVYNTVIQCSDLVAELGILGYSVTPDATEPITSGLLAPYDIFIIPKMMEGTSGTGGDPTLIDNAEVTAIRNFVEGGGGFVIMEASDFMGYNYNKVQNKILKGLGLEYYFQDDQISDDTNNWGNAVYQIIADVDTTTEIGSLYQAATGKTTVGLYSTCSMAEAGPGVNLFVLPDYQVGMPGDTIEYRITVSNPENPFAEDLTYNLSLEESADWSPSISPTSLFVPIGGSEDATLSVTIPANIPLSNEDTIVVTAVASGYPEVQVSFTTVAHVGLRIEPTDDTYVSTQENDTNYNDENSLRIGRYYDYWQWPYLKFDLSKIPSNANITDARLYLYAYYKYAGGFDVLCHEVEDDIWMEATITWNTKATPGAILDTEFVDYASRDSPKSYSWDVTSFVVDEFAGDKIASFCLRPPDNLPESITRAFWSKERYENRVHPFLRISYTTEVVERGVSVSISPSSRSSSPGDDVTFTVTVRNEGVLDDSYSLTVTDTADWSPSISPSTLTLYAGASGTATLAVTISSDAENGATDSITVTATSQTDSTVSDSASCIARGLCIPDIWVEPTGISITLPPDDTGERILKIGNDGDATLVYNISDIEISTIETSTVSIFSANVQSSTETMGDIGTSSLKVAVPADTVEGTIDGGIGKDAYVPTVAQSTTRDGVIRLGVWWPRYDGDLPPYEDLAAEGIEASDVIDLNADTLPYYDVVYIGRGAFYVHTGEGDMDVEAVKDWVSNGGAIIGESESVIYDSVPTLGVDWSPQLSYVCGVWSTEADGWDYVAGDITVTLNPGHPISNGLPETFSTTVYSIEDAAYLDLGRNPTAEEVGTVESSMPGIPPIIASNYGQGRAVYFPYCPDGYTDWSSVGGQYLEQLFINAIKWAAPDCPWLDENPNSGSVEPDSYDEITVTIDTTGLDLGDYSANIVINNNDPDEDPKVVPVYLTVTVVPREWDASITATFSGGSDDAVFSVRPDATPGFDDAYDIPEPPPPVAPSYVRTFFYYPEQTPDELHRSSLAPEDLMEWPLRIEYAERLEDITLTWNIEDVPVDYSVFLYRGENLVADMRAEESYTFEASTGNYDFRIVVGRFVPFTLELAQGWNMISFPVLLENSSPDAVFGSYYVLYRWDAVNKRYVLHADSGSFIEPDPDVEVGVGYWAYVLENENVNLLGVPVNQLTLNLRQGWNLIGPPYGGSSIADLADDPDNSVIPWAFTWNAHEKSYSMTQLLEAGKGYWVYALQSPQPPYPAISATSAKSGDNEIRINVSTGSIPANEWAYSVSSAEGSYSWTTGTVELDPPYVSLGTYAPGTYYVSLKHIDSGHLYFYDQTITTS